MSPERAPLPDRSALSDDVQGVCAYAGHEWAPGGGGLLICMVCDEEAWADSLTLDEESPK